MYPLKGTSREKNRPLCTVCARPPLGLGTWILPPPVCSVVLRTLPGRQHWEDLVSLNPDWAVPGIFLYLQAPGGGRVAG